MRDVATGLVAAGSLIAGFAVAEATGVRPLGGVVLLAGGAWCATRWWRERGPVTAAALGAGYIGAFVASHPLAGVVGAWPSVGIVSTAVGVAAWAVADRRAPTRVSAPSAPAPD